MIIVTNSSTIVKPELDPSVCLSVCLSVEIVICFHGFLLAYFHEFIGCIY